jgi:hypothetical protein
MESARPTPGTRFIIAILIVLIIRLTALPLPGTEDVGTWKIWAFAASKDVTTVYGVGGDPPVRGLLEWRNLYTTVDYPPVALYELGLAGRAYRAVDRQFKDGRALTAAVKIPGVIFGIALTIFLWWSVKRFTGSDASARWVALAYWLNPATILNGEVLGSGSAAHAAGGRHNDQAARAARRASLCNRGLADRPLKRWHPPPSAACSRRSRSSCLMPSSARY